MKKFNYYAIAMTLLAFQFGGFQNNAKAQSQNSYRGEYLNSDAGEGIELIPYGNPGAFDDSQQSFQLSQNGPQGYGNDRSYGRVPYQNGQPDRPYAPNRYERPTDRANFDQSNLPERGYHRRGRNQNRNYRASYQDAAQRDEPLPQRENWDERRERYGTFREEFADPESQVARPEGHHHRGGCRGRCNSKRRGGAGDQFREGQDYPLPNDSQLDRPFRNQLPNNEADFPPSLKVPITRYDDI